MTSNFWPRISLGRFESAIFSSLTKCSKLSDCETQRVDIAADSRWASEYKIVVVPTLVVFNNNEEAKRFQANIMMTMEATKKEVQDAIDEIIMEAF